MPETREQIELEMEAYRQKIQDMTPAEIEAEIERCITAILED